MPTLSLPAWLTAGSFFGNTPLDYLTAAFAFAVTLLLFKLLRDILLTKLKDLARRTETDLDDLALSLINAISPFEYNLLAFFVATRYLSRSPGFDKGLQVAILMVFSFRAAVIAHGLASYWLQKAVTSREISQDAKDAVLSGAGVIVRTLIWVAAALFVLDNLGINVTTVLAGLGIGGVAVALAAQAILGDLFNFFVILLDRPFKTGDFVTFGGHEGTIENVGLKSTRIRSLSGEVIVISNSRLLSAELRNYNQMTRRRVAFKLSVPHRTPADKLRKVPALIKEAVVACGGTFDRSNLSACADSSLDFETVYFVEKPEYAAYMKLNENILLSLVEAFRREGLEFAQPARTVLVTNQTA